MVSDGRRQFHPRPGVELARTLGPLCQDRNSTLPPILLFQGLLFLPCKQHDDFASFLSIARLIVPLSMRSGQQPD